MECFAFRLEPCGLRSPPPAGLHLARAITRRAERAMVGAHRIHGLNPEALRYINRLSDYLFTAARRANAVGDGGTGAGDVLWKPGASR